MKNLLLAIIITIIMLPALAFADVYVRGYTKSNGTYVQPHYRSSPDNTINNNYSTRGNTNPYTGQRGYVPREPAANPYSYPYVSPAINQYPYIKAY